MPKIYIISILIQLQLDGMRVYIITQITSHELTVVNKSFGIFSKLLTVSNVYIVIHLITILISKCKNL